MQGVSFDSTDLLGCLCIVRERLDEIIERGALVQPEELHYLRQFVSRWEQHYGSLQSSL